MPGGATLHFVVVSAVIYVADNAVYPLRVLLGCSLPIILFAHDKATFLTEQYFDEWYYTIPCGAYHTDTAQCFRNVKVMENDQWQYTR